MNEPNACVNRRLPAAAGRRPVEQIVRHLAAFTQAKGAAQYFRFLQFIKPTELMHLLDADIRFIDDDLSKEFPFCDLGGGCCQITLESFKPLFQ